MRLHFDVATFHREVERAEGTGEEDAIVDDFVERQRQGDEADGGPGVFDFDLARRFVLSLRPARRDTFKARIAACLSCHKSKVIAGGGEAAQLKIIQCTACHCVMNAKARFRGSVCPLGRFEAETD